MKQTPTDASDSTTTPAETKSGTFKQIAHISIKAKDLNRSIEYYQKLGFSTVFRFTRGGIDCGAYLEVAPGNYIEIFEDTSLEQVVNNGIAHFCLEVESIDSIMAQLSEAQVSFTQKKLGCDRTWQIWLSDPDGNQFEVHQYTEKSAQLTTGGSVEVDW
jgi:lactoylglutathione lyase/glyoxylase I family protein